MAELDNSHKNCTFMQKVCTGENGLVVLVGEDDADLRGIFDGTVLTFLESRQATARPEFMFISNRIFWITAGGNVALRHNQNTIEEALPEHGHVAGRLLVDVLMPPFTRCADHVCDISPGAWSQLELFELGSNCHVRERMDPRVGYSASPNRQVGATTEVRELRAHGCDLL